MLKQFAQKADQALIEAIANDQDPKESVVDIFKEAIMYFRGGINQVLLHYLNWGIPDDTPTDETVIILERSPKDIHLNVTALVKNALYGDEADSHINMMARRAAVIFCEVDGHHFDKFGGAFEESMLDLATLFVSNDPKNPRYMKFPCILDIDYSIQPEQSPA